MKNDLTKENNLKPHSSLNMKPVIDWELGIKLVNNKKDLAEEMLFLLTKSLPSELFEIKKAYANKDYPELLKNTHKLHGAVCYCGVPRLKDAIFILETSLKQKKYSEIETLFNQFEAEAHAVLKEAATLQL